MDLFISLPTLIYGLIVLAISLTLFFPPVLKYPLALLLILVTFIQLIAYTLLRLFISFLEAFRLFCRSHRELRAQVRYGHGSSTYGEWRERALLLDILDGRESWKHINESDNFNWKHALALREELCICIKAMEREWGHAHDKRMQAIEIARNAGICVNEEYRCVDGTLVRRVGADAYDVMLSDPYSTHSHAIYNHSTRNSGLGGSSSLYGHGSASMRDGAYADDAHTLESVSADADAQQLTHHLTDAPVPPPLSTTRVYNRKRPHTRAHAHTHTPSRHTRSLSQTHHSPTSSSSSSARTPAPAPGGPRWVREAWLPKEPVDVGGSGALSPCCCDLYAGADAHCTPPSDSDDEEDAKDDGEAYLVTPTSSDEMDGPGPGPSHSRSPSTSTIASLPRALPSPKSVSSHVSATSTARHRRRLLPSSAPRRSQHPSALYHQRLHVRAARYRRHMLIAASSSPFSFTSTSAASAAPADASPPASPSAALDVDVDEALWHHYIAPHELTHPPFAFPAPPPPSPDSPALALSGDALVARVEELLRVCVDDNVAGTHNPLLFTHTNAGTKTLSASLTLHVARAVILLSVRPPPAPSASAPAATASPLTASSATSSIYRQRLQLNAIPPLTSADAYSHPYTTNAPIPSFLSTARPPTAAFLAAAPSDDALASLTRLHGHTALCLSGGAGLGVVHVGILSALCRERALPNIIAGTSAGSLFAALACTRSEETLLHDLRPGVLAQHMGFDSGLSPVRIGLRLLTAPPALDPDNWRKLLRWHCNGDLTFQEAFEMTGRVLVITAAAAHPAQSPLLLSHLNAPDIVIWSAVTASASIPLLLPSVRLMRKRACTGCTFCTENNTLDSNSSKSPKCGKGVIEPVSVGGWGEGLRDGSIVSDIPVSLLRYQHNARLCVAVQVNPHVAPFMYKARGESGRLRARWAGWRGGYIACVLESVIRGWMYSNLGTLREMAMVPVILGVDVSQIWTQGTGGDVTIAADVGIKDIARIVSTPREEHIAEMKSKGQLLVWAHLARLEQRMVVGRALRWAAVRQVKMQVDKV